MLGYWTLARATSGLLLNYSHFAAHFASHFAGRFATHYFATHFAAHFVGHFAAGRFPADHFAARHYATRRFREIVVTPQTPRGGGRYFGEAPGLRVLPRFARTAKRIIAAGY